MKKRDTLGSDEGLGEGDMPEEYLMEDFDYLVSISTPNYTRTGFKARPFYTYCQQKKRSSFLEQFTLQLIGIF